MYSVKYYVSLHEMQLSYFVMICDDYRNEVWFKIIDTMI